jgi:diacylglycerol kinase family enzyme
VTAILAAYHKAYRSRRALFEALCAELSARHADLAVVVGDSPRSLSKELATRGEPNFVYAAGGDGLLRDLLNVYAGQPVSYGIVPMGTGNDTARGLGVPRDPIRAVGTMGSGTVAVFPGKVEFPDGSPTSGRMESIYAGRSSILFANSAGTGIDSATVQAREILSHIRINHYLLTFLVGVLPRLAPFQVVVFCGDEVVYDGDAVWVVALRGPSIGGGIRLDPAADLRKPELRLLVVKGAGRLRVLRELPTVLGGRALQSPLVRSFAGESFRLEFSEPRPITIDGDILASAQRLNLGIGPALRFSISGAA